jgi:hypothetical protein
MTSRVCNLGTFDISELQRYGQYRQAIRAATRETRELADGLPRTRSFSLSLLGCAKSEADI